MGQNSFDSPKELAALYRLNFPKVIEQEFKKGILERESKEAKTIKIEVKKKYLAGLCGLLSISIGLFFVQEIFRWVLSQNITVLIILVVFVISTIYTVGYFMDYNVKIKIAEEAAKEVAEGDVQKETEIKEHLLNKIWNESYSFNIKP